MGLRHAVWSAAFLIAMTIPSAAQNQKPKIKHVPAALTSPASGREMFRAYCASCHGQEAKGNGPAAPALAIPPADLTTLAIRNGGTYPYARVTSILRGQAKVTAHGTQDMPVWGPIFLRMSQGNEAEVLQRIANLNRYIQSLQKK